MADEDALERMKLDLLELADFAYGRLRDRLDGLADEEYGWEPVPGCWSVRPAADGTYRMDSSPGVTPAPLTTIAWRLCHVIDLLAAPRNATWIGVAPGAGWSRDGEPGTAAEAVAELERAYTLFRGYVASVLAGTLADAMGPVAGPFGASTRAAFVLHELDELIHHGAEIATMRDLYRVMVGAGRE